MSEFIYAADLDQQPEERRTLPSPNRRAPRIGMRIIKTSIVVFICFVIYWLRGQGGLPFYSGVAAIICMQPYVGGSVRAAFNRTIGTFIGGALGVLYLLTDRLFELSLNHVMLNYLIISLLVIPLIYVTVLIKRPESAPITCVVFMCIAVGYGGNIGSYTFALNRLIDTIIGIFVSLAVNSFRIPRKKARQVLFITNLEGTLLNSHSLIGAASVVKLNQMLDNGAMITVATDRTPATFMPLLQNIRLKLPVIAINGAALFDMAERRYKRCKFIPDESAAALRKLITGHGHNLFYSTIINEVHHVYYDGAPGPVEERLILLWRNLPGKYYVRSVPPDGYSALCLTVAGIDAAVHEMCDAVDKIAPKIGVYTRCHKMHGQDDVLILDIYSVEASREIAVREMKERLEAKRLVVVGNSDDDIPMLMAADLSLAVAGSSDNVKKAATRVIGSNDNDSPARQLHRLFYWKKSWDKNV